MTMTLTATAELDHSIWRIVVDTPFVAKDAVKAVPGARWNTALKKWTTPVSWTACLALRAEYQSGLTIGDELHAWALDVADRKQAIFDLRAKIEDTSTPIPPLPGFETLLSHQWVDAQLIATAHSFLNLNETGTGKTRSVGAGLSLLKEHGHEIFPVLVVAPKSVVINWKMELELLFPSADIRVVQGTPSKIRKAMEPGGHFYIMGWDSLSKYSRLAPFGSISLSEKEKEPKEIQSLGFRTFVADEIHRAKNPKSKRTRAAWAAAEDAHYRIGLTGTPIQETPEDMYGVLRCLFPNEYPTKTGFVDRYLNVDWNLWGGREITGIKPATKDEFFKILDGLSRRLTKEVVLPFLPEKVQEDRWVTLPPKVRKAYDEMKDTLRTQLEEGTLDAENAMVQAGRLLQLANSYGELDPDGKFIMTEPSPKVDAFIEDAEEGDYDGSQVVVFSDSRQLASRLAERMAYKKMSFVEINGDVTGEDRQKAVDSFQAGEVQYCILTRAGGEGITLTAADTMVRLYRPWSRTVFDQVEDRVHRIGSEKHEVVVYRDYKTLDSIEIGQWARLMAKGAAAQEVLRDDEILELIK